jgi:hypothetical protein
MEEAGWEQQFRDAYQRARAAYEQGADTPAVCVADTDRKLLAEIGCSPQELFDFVEDDVTVGEPGLEKTLAITRVRWEYLSEVERGKAPERIRRTAEFPSPAETLGGIPWLPRIIAKARAKLRGELPPDLMYSCGGDRRFLREHGLEADAFLRAVWRAGEEDGPILEYVQRRGQG